MSIFAWGGPAPDDDATETSWIATRQLLAGSIHRATRHLVEHGLAARGAPALARFVSIVATRFSATAAEKLALQMVPVIGAVTGASINTIFVRYYQQTADAHFSIRRLERIYGEAAVQDELRRLAESGSVR
ncbi:MAG: hypothetical protein D6761_00640 [Candidatus Dadabacteria bacterium]|nr:MAG: hypothetical protein D6761_00640 [Candidatus Dadabacteria bacterium]